jgi:hypothetical protein
MPESPDPPSLLGWINSPRLRALERWLWERPLVAWLVFILSLLVVTVPTFGNMAWYSVYSEPPIPAILKKMLAISEGLHFSATWIAVPIGIAMFVAMFYLMVMGRRISRQETSSGGIKLKLRGTVSDVDPHLECQRTISNLESTVRRLQRDNETWGIVVNARDADIAHAKKEYEALDQQLNLHRQDLLNERERNRLLQQQEKPKRAEIKGEILSGSFKEGGKGPIDTYTVTVRVRIYNVGEETRLMSFGLKLSHPHGNQTWTSKRIESNPIADDQRNLAEMVNTAVPFDFKPGKPEDGWLRFYIRARPQSFELFSPVLLVRNGFGEDYEISNKDMILRRIS